MYTISFLFKFFQDFYPIELLFFNLLELFIIFKISFVSYFFYIYIFSKKKIIINLKK